MEVQQHQPKQELRGDVQHEYNSLVLDLGNVAVRGLALLRLNPINNERIAQSSDQPYEPAFDRLFQAFCALDLDQFNGPILSGLNQVLAQEIFPEIHGILGEYPRGAEVQVFSAQDAREILTRTIPSYFKIAMPHPRDDYANEAYEAADELALGKFKDIIFNAFTDLYRQHIEPNIPREIIEDPHFGGVAFHYQWIDRWQPLESVVTISDPYEVFPSSRLVDPLHPVQVIENTVLRPRRAEISDLGRTFVYGTVLPKLIDDELGIPRFLEMMIDCPRGEEDPKVGLIIAHDDISKKSVEYLRHYNDDVVGRAFPKLAAPIFGEYCREKLFPAIDQLGEMPGVKCNGLKFNFALY